MEELEGGRRTYTLCVHSGGTGGGPGPTRTGADGHRSDGPAAKAGRGLSSDSEPLDRGGLPGRVTRLPRLE